MPTLETLERFVAKVETNEHDQAIAEFYTEDATIQENLGEIKRGRDQLIANEKAILARAKSVTSECVRPFFVSDNHAIIRWKFRFVFHNDRVMELEELAYQRWEGERIAEEQFFYDPAQRELK